MMVILLAQTVTALSEGPVAEGRTCTERDEMFCPLLIFHTLRKVISLSHERSHQSIKAMFPSQCDLQMNIKSRETFYMQRAPPVVNAQI